ncbi:hypothetical protein CEE34_05260 [Candidatus Aerophobetes bacterium Ae_b3a]|nr:MAG: hypothetical protein CEE34_05260 [Candidatus Aerophobetes bacterium Ae_b3a]
MSRMKEERLFNKVNELSKKWCFYLILFIILFLPSIATQCTSFSFLFWMIQFEGLTFFEFCYIIIL